MTKGQETRIKILLKSAELFMKNGFEETTFSQIAKQVKISQPALYAYFKNKMDILKNSALHSAQAGREFIDEKIDQNKPAQVRLQQYVASNLEFFNSQKILGYCLVSVYYFAASNKDVFAAYYQIQQIGINRIEHFLSQGQFEGAWQIHDKQAAAALIHSLLVGEIYKQFYFPDEKTVSDRTKGIMQAISKICRH